LVPALNICVHWLIFLFFRESTLHPIANAVLAVIWGALGIYSIYYSLNWVVEQYPDQWKRRILPFVFVGPAVLLLGWLLVLPAVRTLYLSFFNATSDKFVGLANYAAVFTDRLLVTALRNNLLWVFFGTILCVGF